MAYAIYSLLVALLYALLILIFLVFLRKYLKRREVFKEFENEMGNETIRKIESIETIIFSSQLILAIFTPKIMFILIVILTTPSFIMGILALFSSSHDKIKDYGFLSLISIDKILDKLVEKTSGSSRAATYIFFSGSMGLLISIYSNSFQFFLSDYGIISVYLALTLVAFISVWYAYKYDNLTLSKMKLKVSLLYIIISAVLFATFLYPSVFLPRLFFIQNNYISPIISKMLLFLNFAIFLFILPFLAFISIIFLVIANFEDQGREEIAKKFWKESKYLFIAFFEVWGVVLFTFLSSFHFMFSIYFKIENIAILCILGLISWLLQDKIIMTWIPPKK